MGETEKNTAIRWLVVMTVVVIAGFSVICCGVLWHMRTSDMRLAQNVSANLVASIEGEITRTVDLYGLSLDAVVDGLKIPGFDGLDKKIQSAILFDRSASAKSYGPIDVIDERGRVRISSESHRPTSLSVKTEQYFIVQQESDRGLFISAPLQTANGEYVLMLSRRLSDRNGEFAGIVAGSIKLAFFHDLFRRIELPEDGTLALFDGENRIIMRVPFEFGDVGRRISLQRTNAEQQKDHGSFETVSPIDGIKRLVAWKTSRFPLTVYNGQSISMIYNDWYMQATVILAAVALMSFMMGLVTVGQIREMRRRQAAEAELRILALTDGLTGLANRRAFDIRLDSEIRRVARNGLPFALLLIDVDHFKSFNDVYGHQAGDGALAAMAAAIAESIRDGVDFAARFGGEEFAVILPNTTDTRAMVVAERIRQRAEAITHLPRTITASIGVADTCGQQSSAAELLRSADELLYQAKAAGRNNCQTRTRPALRIVA